MSEEVEKTRKGLKNRMCSNDQRAAVRLREAGPGDTPGGERARERAPFPWGSQPPCQCSPDSSHLVVLCLYGGQGKEEKLPMLEPLTLTTPQHRMATPAMNFTDTGAPVFRRQMIKTANILLQLRMHPTLSLL